MIGTADIFSWGFEGGFYRVAQSFATFFFLVMSWIKFCVFWMCDLLRFFEKQVPCDGKRSGKWGLGLGLGLGRPKKSCWDGEVLQ